ncbi:LuxR C-terminal-related transcriptional regulator [Azospirillum humicireducens]|uniref:LuxR C-terminal-related transcriptional regulator n=1 Tax=Azospirillum humicireducens TaxID=1226968 RepID=UPI001F37FF3A|nr:response regulator transcription factor [Azospirillum humicireducens]
MVDEQPMVRHGFALSIGEICPGTRVLEAGSLDEALDIGRKTPELALVLYDPGPQRGEEAEASGGAIVGLRRLKETLGEVPVLILTNSDEVADIVDSVRMGARGYVLKTSPPEVLEHAISLALSGDVFLPLPRAVLNGALSEGPRGNDDILDRLTDRQRDVFELLLAGHSNKEIARGLGVLEGTVKVHVRAIMQKLGVRNRTQVAVVAARNGCFNGEG